VLGNFCHINSSNNDNGVRVSERFVRRDKGTSKLFKVDYNTAREMAAQRRIRKEKMEK